MNHFDIGLYTISCEVWHSLSSCNFSIAAEKLFRVILMTLVDGQHTRYSRNNL